MATYTLKNKKKLTNEPSLLEAFDKVWGPHHVICIKAKCKVKCGAINHLTLIIVSFGRCVVIGAKVGCPLGFVVYWFSFCKGFSFCVKKKKHDGWPTRASQNFFVFQRQRCNNQKN